MNWHFTSNYMSDEKKKAHACERCGDDFRKSRPDKRFCSEKCRKLNETKRWASKRRKPRKLKTIEEKKQKSREYIAKWKHEQCIKVSNYYIKQIFRMNNSILSKLPNDVVELKRLIIQSKRTYNEIYRRLNDN